MLDFPLSLSLFPQRGCTGACSLLPNQPGLKSGGHRSSIQRATDVTYQCTKPTSLSPLAFILFLHIHFISRYVSSHLPPFLISHSLYHSQWHSHLSALSLFRLALHHIVRPYILETHPVWGLPQHWSPGEPQPNWKMSSRRCSSSPSLSSDSHLFPFPCSNRFLIW